MVPPATNNAPASEASNGALEEIVLRSQILLLLRAAISPRTIPIACVVGAVKVKVGLLGAEVSRAINWVPVAS